MREEKDMENKTEAQCLYELAMKHIYGNFYGRIYF